MLELKVEWSNMWQRQCVYMDVPGIGWHILGFL